MATERSHDVDYEIFGDDLQYVEIELDPGETIVGEGGFDWPASAAGATLFLLPVLVFTILLRKQLLRGITFGAVRK